jgi:pimeloyl-ACP methyl ester carboxylesterase
VLFVHGASFPSGLAAAFQFDGVSWMGDLAARGFDVWALDFLGYGKSDRYPEMNEPATAHPPLGRAPEAARQIDSAVGFITRRRGGGSRGEGRVSLVAHSWGTVPAGLFAGQHPARVERLVLFGPIARRTTGSDPTPGPAYWFVTEEEQRTRFLGYVPQGEARVFDPRYLDAWGPAYMKTDSTSTTRTPPSVQVPYGPIADLEAAWAGRFPFDPAKITAPVLIIRGEWEEVTPDADARWLYDALSHAALKRDVKISHATHVMHLERARYQLYREVAAFLAGHDLPSAAAPGARTEARRPISATPHFALLLHSSWTPFPTCCGLSVSKARISTQSKRRGRGASKPRPPGNSRPESCRRPNTSSPITF